jgi:hypothetical protein
MFPSLREQDPCSAEHVWQSRKEALNGAIDRTIDTVSDALAGKGYSPPDKDRLAKLLRFVLMSLRTFVGCRFEYFCQNGPPAGYSKEYGWTGTLVQAGRDLNAIQQVAFQRITGGPELQAALERADCLAQRALDPAIEAGLFDRYQPRPTVLTYFQKSPLVRTIPYAPVALIGIPYTCAAAGGASLQDLFAIPHEVGHFVYWWGRNDASQLFVHNSLARMIDEEYPNFQPWARPWLEECIADIYGCLVAGPLMAISSQVLAASRSRFGLTKDDGEHPVAGVRPLLYAKTLARIQGYEGWAKVVANLWHATLRERNTGQEFMSVYSRARDWRVGLKEPRFEFDKIIELLSDLIDRIDAKAQGNWWRKTASADPPRNPGDELQNLLDRFADQAAGVRDADCVKYEIDAILGQMNGDGAFYQKRYAELQSELIQQAEIMKDSGRGPWGRDSSEATRSKEREWFAVLEANGWADDDGPGEVPPYP